METTKKCTKCHQEKPLSDFYRYKDKDGTSRGYRSACKRCYLDYNAKVHTETAGLIPKKDELYAEYLRLYVAQGAKCALCGNLRSSTPLELDRTSEGKIRGLICKTCRREIESIQLDDILVRRVLERFDDPRLVRIAQYWLGELEPNRKVSCD